jgi:hypothetical protein
MVEPPKRPDEMSVEEAHAIRDSFAAIVAEGEALRREEHLDGEELSRRLFDRHQKTFLQYGQTCFLFVSGRVSGERTLQHVFDNIVDPVERGNGNKKRVQQIIEENGVRGHWRDMAHDAALSAPDAFEDVIDSILKNATGAKGLEALIRREQLQVLTKALKENQTAFDAAEASATNAKAKSAFAAARQIVARS